LRSFQTGIVLFVSQYANSNTTFGSRFVEIQKTIKDSTLLLNMKTYHATGGNQSAMPSFVSTICFFAAIMLTGLPLESRAQAAPAPAETQDTWHGFTRHNFAVAGCRAWVVEPKEARSGKPWSWCMEFPDAFTDRCAAPALLKQGFHHGHIVVGNTFGSPAALKQFDAFYEAMMARGLGKKPVLIGISRGGLYAYRWASENLDKVSVIYGDAPVCDFKSWPGGKGQGKGSSGDWTSLLKCYGFKDEAEALAYKGNPIDVLAPLARAKIALIHVVGDADDVVPVPENTAIVEARYLKLGGEIKVIHKPGIGHHPHGLEDPTPVVDFILAHAAGARTLPARP
jgi:pimeloyl-ACP methyl ester carboxylesterase